MSDDEHEDLEVHDESHETVETHDETVEVHEPVETHEPVTEIIMPVQLPVPSASFVPLPESERAKPLTATLDDKSKINVVFIYPQSVKPEISIDGGPFIALPSGSNKQTIAVDVKGDNIFPFTCVFRNEFKTYRKQTFEYYAGIDASQVSIQRAK